MHILYAEDAAAIALPVIQYLSKLGHRVTHVLDGRQAVDAYMADPPDLVLLDIVMPEMDGIEAMRQIHATPVKRWIPVILLTGLSGTDELVRGLDAGADDYLTKPVVLEVLGARLRSMQRIAILQHSLSGILDNVFEAIITIDEKGLIQSFNIAAERIFGYAGNEVMGCNVNMLMPSPYAGEHDGYLARYRSERTPRVIGIGRKVRGLRKNGETFPMRLAVTEIQEGAFSKFIGLVSDISEEEAARARIEFLALHDPLTGLPNRAHFNEALERILALDDQRHALLFIDLDGFKPINDTLGHEAGDEALRQVAARMRHNLAANDFAARLGGDEFVAIARDITDAVAARKIARRLIDAIAQPMTLGGRAALLGASIGIAMVHEHGMNATEIITAADNAMYAAKRAGKGCAVVAGASAGLS